MSAFSAGHLRFLCHIDLERRIFTLEASQGFLELWPYQALECKYAAHMCSTLQQLSLSLVISIGRHRQGHDRIWHIHGCAHHLLLAVSECDTSSCVKSAH
eukprot:2178821-Amphidinium_carterae.1